MFHQNVTRFQFSKQSYILVRCMMQTSRCQLQWTEKATSNYQMWFNCLQEKAQSRDRTRQESTNGLSAIIRSQPVHNSTEKLVLSHHSSDELITI